MDPYFFVLYVNDNACIYLLSTKINRVFEYTSSPQSILISEIAFL